MASRCNKSYAHDEVCRGLSRPEIVATLSQQLSWSHFRELLPLNQPLQREFYAEMCRVEGWSVRTLRERIDSMLYERTALSRKPENSPDRSWHALRSKGRSARPWSSKILTSSTSWASRISTSRRDFEDAILRELELFLLELGAGFSFVARQKRIQLTEKTSTSTCCSTTASSSGLLPSS